jgi:hypothetical protein
MEAALAAEGKKCIAPKGSLRHAARPAQAIIGGEEGDNPLAMQITAIQHTIVYPRDRRSDDQD